MTLQDYQQQNNGNCLTSYFIGIALLLLASCANPVSPTGGPRDTDPPLILRAAPENASVNFDGDEIRLWFDEFIQVRGLSQQFLSSPPFKKVPETRIRGKSLTILLGEDLRSNTTYTLFFGNSISDFNEGNAIANYRFIFSTGPVLDSMELQGRVVNARSLAPEKDVFVMLYDSYQDSIPLLERPYYISRTNDKGEFTFTNLRDIAYKIFALRDVNANLIYDQPNEEIAFLSNLVYPTPPVRPRKTETTPTNDTILPENGIMPEIDTIPLLLHESENDMELLQLEGTGRDEIELGLDDLETDILNDTIEKDKKPEAIVLYLFNEIDSIQRLSRSEYLHPNKLQFVFRFPVKDLAIDPVPPIDHEWKIPETSSKADTIWYWLLDIERDSLKLEVKAANMKTDTVKLALSRMHTYREEKLADTTIIWMDVKNNLPRTGPFNKHEPIRLVFSEPLSAYNHERIILLEDSVRVEPEISFKDEVQRVVIINYSWKDTVTYDLFVPDSAFIGIYGHYNDTIKHKFKTRMQSDYGNLKVYIDHMFEDGQLLVELMNERGDVLKMKIVSLELSHASFFNLLPGKYQLKVVHDANNNGKWDTGAYLNGLQPERVYIFDKTLELRANWDLEETFTVPKD